MKTIKELEKLDREIMEEEYVKSYRSLSLSGQIFLFLALILMAVIFCCVIYGMLNVIAIIMGQK